MGSPTSRLRTTFRFVSAHRALADCLLLARCFEAVDDVPGLLALAMRPRATFRAIVSYDDRESRREGWLSVAAGEEVVDTGEAGD